MIERIPITVDELVETYSSALGIVSVVIRDAPELAEMMIDTLWKYPKTAHIAERLTDFFVRADARRKARAASPAEDPEEVAAEIARQEYGSTT